MYNWTWWYWGTSWDSLEVIFEDSEEEEQQLEELPHDSGGDLLVLLPSDDQEKDASENEDGDEKQVKEPNFSGLVLIEKCVSRWFLVS